MSTEILFSEKQRFKQWWLYLLLGGTNAYFIFAAFKQIIIGNPFINNPISNSRLLYALGTSLLITVLALSIKLETKIKQDGVYVRFFPLPFKRYPWDKILKSYIRKYSPLSEYGGWGYRYGSGGKAFNISGNRGLQLEFTDKKKLLIGTQKPEEMEKILIEIGQLKA